MDWHTKKIGILGGGQLGKMLCEAAAPLGIQLHILDKDRTFPAAMVCHHFHCGDFRNYDDVLQFGKNMDVLSIEIENVNTQALRELSNFGKDVYPQAEIIELIKDKGKQKQFFASHHFPTAPFQLFQDKEEIQQYLLENQGPYPVFQKSRTEGYDGRGVQQLKGPSDLAKIWDVPSLLEQGISIQREIAVIVARDHQGQSASYPVVEMHFHPTANLLDYQLCPARISERAAKQAEKLAISIAEILNITGLLAVEMFLDHNGNCLVNELAPRPHNSGHHTIEAHETSQYEQLVRILAKLPLGSIAMRSPSVLVNLLGSESYTGPAKYVGVESCLALEGVHLHLYGKKETRPFRKMGHVCILDNDLEAAIEKANFAKEQLKVIA